jgi:hypothetical protein
MQSVRIACTTPSKLAMSSVKILVEATQPEKRVGEPVTLGIPWPQGVLKESSYLSLQNEQGKDNPLQTTVLDKWKDGSIRWLLLDFQAELQGNTSYRLQILSQTKRVQPPHTLNIIKTTDAISINTGKGTFSCSKKHQVEFLSFQPATKGDVVEASLHVVDEQGKNYFPDITHMEIENEGVLRTCLCLSGTLKHDQSDTALADLFIRIHFFAGHPTAKIDVTIRNPRKAEHPGGLWDLGNGGAIYLKDAAIVIKSLGENKGLGQLSIEPGKESLAFESTCELYQDSSGGENWKSTNHVNRKGIVPLSFPGYRCSLDAQQLQGKRATPIVSVPSSTDELALAVPDFWQNFPKALEAQAGEITYRLFPRHSADVHEIQGGEQKSHLCFIAFGPDTITEKPLEWSRSPSVARAEPTWYAASGTIPWLTSREADSHVKYLQLVDAALDGDDTFDRKREVIDEYGWRHYGDIYGDHEAVFHKGPQPLVSHYNNQYDAVAGLGYQYLRSGDQRWLSEMEAHARHVIDIDIYHTTQDKSAYNQGLFWHTFHYVDACTGTHRSYPKDARVPPKGQPVPGGGPANEQNYSTGLMLHYFLTGHRPSRDAALGLAQWVIDMDDGNKTIFRWLSRSHTGAASSSRSPEYHGPGRGAANSILVLMDGFRLSQDRKYLDKAEQIIRRCIHPDDNIPKRNLLDAENRWFYTMFLQALGKYLHYKAELGELDNMYAYAQVSLVNYARWMAGHEYPYLSKPELLEYPTETWVAQDIRKCEIFHQAALHCDDTERERFRERANYFFDYVVNTLSQMPTKTLCRPVVLLLNYGFAHDWFKKHADVWAPKITNQKFDFGIPRVFVPQKQIAMRRAKLIIAAGGVLFLIAVSSLIYYWLS